jgi:hypothetical protein
VLGRIRETDVSTTLRVNWTFSPHLTLQAYAQPYIASGHYSELKDVDYPQPSWLVRHEPRPVARNLTARRTRPGWAT